MAVVGIAPRRASVVVAVLCAGLLAGVGLVVGWNPMLGMAMSLAVLVVGLIAVDGVLPAVYAIPALVIVQRVGSGGGLSISDLVLFAAFWPALVLTRREPDPALRTLLWIDLAYQATILFTVIVNPYAANVVEWFHSYLLVSGALLVGWAVGFSGRARQALTMLLVVCCVIAALVLGSFAANASRGRFDAVYLEWPWEMHKNFTGCVLAFAVALAYARPDWLGWHRRLTFIAMLLCFAGVLASQSRQAIVSIAVALVLIAFRSGQIQSRSKLVLVGIVPIIYFVWEAVQQQLASGNKFNSIYQRVEWFEQSLQVWRTNEWFGVGLRWWYTDRFPFAFHPPQLELEVLSSAGVVGLAGLAVLMIGTLWVLWQVDPCYGTLAFSVVLMRFVQGQFDLFWVAAQVSIPFAIAGICLGTRRLHQGRRGIAFPTGKIVPRPQVPELPVRTS